VVPEFDTPAHFSPLITTYPELTALSYDANNNSFRCLVDPSNPDLWPLLDSLWTQAGAVLPDAVIHIGGDEVGRRSGRVLPVLGIGAALWAPLVRYRRFTVLPPSCPPPSPFSSGPAAGRAAPPCPPGWRRRTSVPRMTPTTGTSGR
jgi:hypothetical protein